MNIVLIGYRGTGKSVVARIVAQRLDMTYEGMDANIVETAGTTIPEIVANHGWDRFRQLETEEARRLAGRDRQVVDTGGGVIERPENITALKSNGLIIWLKASVDTIVERIAGDNQRPALTAGKTFTEEVAEVLAQREPKYRDASTFEIDTDSMTPEQVAYTIIETWHRPFNGD